MALSAEAAFLLNDIQGEKSLGKIVGLLGSNSKCVCRGELLLDISRVKVIPCLDGKPAHNYQLASDPAVTLFCTEHDVAPLTDYEYHLMSGVKSREARYEIFQKDILDWGSKLKVGDFVYVALPSKSPVSSQCAVSVIKYIGPLRNEHGMQFGVEIQEDHYRNQGNSNGFFGGEQYFECEENCALFVSLYRLSPLKPVQQEPPPELPPTADPQRQHQMTTRSQNKHQQSDLDHHGHRRDHSPKQPHSRFKMNERVVVYDKRGVGIHGTVRWIQEMTFAGERLIAIGIETDIGVLSKDFEGSLTGYGQHFKCSDSRHGKLVMPESMVISEKLDIIQRDKQKKKHSAQGTSVDAHAHEHEHAHVQYRDVKQAVQQREDEYLKGALHMSRIDRDEQIHLMRQIEKAHKGKQQNAPDNQPFIDSNPNKRRAHYEAIPGPADSSGQPPHQQQPSPRPLSGGPNEQYTQPSTGTSSARGHVHAHESPDRIHRDLLKMRDQHSIQNEHLGLHSGRVPLRHQRSLPAPNSVADHQDPLLEYMHHQQPHGALPEATQGIQFQPQEIVSHSFSLGSTVQLGSDPPRYAVIQWIGTLPGVLEGHIAGVELEEPMDGCGDGIWNGVRYFTSRHGHGFFCPVSSLVPDQRFAQPVTADINPLDYVPLEEQHDQFINPGQIFEYIGEEKGIQGHQNSCYLDSTVFGLFAVSDIFDNIFLQQQQDDPDGDAVKYLLWKGIVNPLRRHGAVRYESVMRLRNKLEELGKMKGVNQDEKDPEVLEFLNMLFKHTLHVPPFISIKRPFGVEDEYFVQLFVEHDESLKLPTIADLLKRMFKDQKILFTKMPSKLLIQVPRFGRAFKTYQKVIPGTKLKVEDLLCSKYCCFMCGDSAWKKCLDCASHFTTNAATPVYFCENCAKLSHGHATKRDKHTVSDVTTESDDLSGLELLSVICIETSHYVCFTRSEGRWVFFDSYASRIHEKEMDYNIPKVVDCTDILTEWVYPANGDLTRLLNTPPRELPEYVRRFTQDIYLCVYVQPDVAMYGDFEDDVEDYDSEDEYKQPEESNKATDVHTMQHEFDELKAKYALLQQQQEKLQQECTGKAAQAEELIEKEKHEQARHQQELQQVQDYHQQEVERIQDQHQQELQQVQGQHQQEFQRMAAEKQSMEQRLFLQENHILELKRKLETANTEVEEVRFTRLLNPQGADSSWNVPRNEVIVKEEIGRGASGLVSKGQFRGQSVAVKQIHQFILSQTHVVNLFKREVRIMASVQHPNLVQFIGAVFDENVENLTATPLLLLELLHTNLRKAYEQRPSNLGASVMLSIFCDMAYGLHYLHEHQEPIIHRDVSAPNVLLEALPGGTWRAKLSDFGSANFLKRSSSLGVGAIVCTAPEMFPRDDPSAPVPRPTVKCDVFSYGIVLVEVITKTMPSLENRHQLFQEVERKWKMMHDLVTRCTQRCPEDRPTMSVVLNLLNRFPVA